MIDEMIVDLISSSIKKNWDLPALSDYRGYTVKYNELAEKILFFHYLFNKYNIKKGDKIAVIGKNSVNWAITYLSSLTYGAVIVPILPDFKADDVHHIVNHSDSVLLFSSEANYSELDIECMNDLEAVFSLTDFNPYFSRKKSLDLSIEKDRQKFLSKYDNNLNSENFNLEPVKNNKLASIVYTSGTTGFSKGVMLPHLSLSVNIVFAQNNMPLNAGDSIVSFLPIAHVFGCVFEFLFPITMGCHITFLSKIPSPKVILKAFQEIHPRLILSVPLVIEKIYKKQIKPTLDKPLIKLISMIPFIENRIGKKINIKLTEVFGGKFHEIVIGGAALNKEVELFLRKIKFRYTVGYGMTECGPLISYSNWDKFKLASTGKIVNSLEIKIDSKDPYNEVGEIMVKGDNVMTGYYKNKEATDTALENGWLRTGDLGVIDKDNAIFIRGRSKSMILGPSGKNIYPEEIEAKLNNLELVQESIIVLKEGRIIALVYPDHESADRLRINNENLKKIMDRNRKELNRLLPGYMTVSEIQIVSQEFEKTPKKSIKRFLYNF
ncbi:AMP-binding protein [Candidatus Cloacimonadota bacterium]